MEGVCGTGPSCKDATGAVINNSSTCLIYNCCFVNRKCYSKSIKNPTRVSTIPSTPTTKSVGSTNLTVDTQESSSFLGIALASSLIGLGMLLIGMALCVCWRKQNLKAKDAQEKQNTKDPQIVLVSPTGAGLPGGHIPADSTIVNHGSEFVSSNFISSQKPLNQSSVTVYDPRPGNFTSAPQSQQPLVQPKAHNSNTTFPNYVPLHVITERSPYHYVFEYSDVGISTAYQKLPTEVTNGICYNNHVNKSYYREPAHEYIGSNLIPDPSTMETTFTTSTNILDVTTTFSGYTLDNLPIVHSELHSKNDADLIEYHKSQMHFYPHIPTK
jgi:hypothetical protein